MVGCALRASRAKRTMRQRKTTIRFAHRNLEKNWDWNKKHPVLKISFGSGVHRSLQKLRETMEAMLNRCYIFEFKVVEDATGEGTALQQIKERKYADKYLSKLKRFI